MKYFQPFLVAALMLCLTIPIILLGEGLLPPWQGSYLFFVIPIVVLEGIWSKNIFRRERLPGSEVFWRVLSEAVVIVLFTKAVSFIGGGFDTLKLSLESWFTAPLSFFEGDTIPVTILVLLVWQMGQGLNTDIERLSDPLASGSERQATRQRIRGFVFTGSVWLLFLSGIMIFITDRTGTFQNRISIPIQAVVIAFFGMSLLLLAHVQYLRRQMEWKLEGLLVPDVVAHRWVRWGLGLTAVILIVAALLPAVYSLGPGQLFNWLVSILTFIWQVLSFLMLLLLSPLILLLSTLMGNPLEEDQIEPKLPEAPQVPQTLPSQLPTWWLPLRQVLVFALIVVVIAIVLYTYSLNRRIPIPSLSSVRDWIRQVRRSFRAWLRGIGLRIRLARDRFRETSIPEWGRDVRRGGWVPLLRARTPRARIRRYYLSLLRRAEGVGHGRLPQQTPNEYETRLIHSVPESRNEIETLTEAFMLARYSKESFSDEEVGLARTAWRKIRDTLRRSRIFRKVESND
ncbi:MAG: DUF4129 domain-containing protein [Anaerolineales bacterium]|nr:DUF4129 domain-containing protein [Anaerolineales bacterium]